MSFNKNLLTAGSEVLPLSAPWPAADTWQDSTEIPSSTEAVFVLVSV